MIRPLAALPFVWILVACTSSSGTQIPEADGYVQLGQDFHIRVGQTAGIFTSQAVDLVRFNGVSQDSRCPVDVECVQAGSATVLLSVQSAFNAHDVELKVPPQGEAEVVVDELTVTVFELDPPATEGVTIGPLDYVAGMVVTESAGTPVPN